MGSSSSKQQRIASFGRKFGMMAVAVAIGCGVTYILCQQGYEARIAELQSRISDLQKKELQAKVTQRVSEQMEDIAFQQKTISDMQREEAVKQSHIADMERGKAEIERGLAQQAQRKAVYAAEQADSMRVVAEMQSELATNHMIAAEKARAKADTLFYLSIGNSLAQSALAKGSVATDISRLLSYASWHYTREYGGSENSYNVYKALLYSSSSIERLNTPLKGNVRDVEMMKIDGAIWTLGITDYGEIILYNNAGEYRKFDIDNAPFRDMALLSPYSCLVLTSYGRVLALEFADAKSPKMRVVGDTQLGPGLWKKMCAVDKGMFAVISDDRLVWLNGKAMSVKAEHQLASGLSAVGVESKNVVHVFGTNGRHYISSLSSVRQYQEANLTAVKEQVTSYFHVQANDFHILGTETGTIYVIDKNGRILNTMMGHTGAITSVKASSEAVVSTSYDNTMRLWSLASMASMAESMEFTFDSWPLSFTVDGTSQMIWIGNEAGGLSRFCISAAQNALATRNLLRREFTKDEWNFYVGESVPFRTFMKGGGR